MTKHCFSVGKGLEQVQWSMGKGRLLDPSKEEKKLLIYYMVGFRCSLWLLPRKFQNKSFKKHCDVTHASFTSVLKPFIH